mmetsp:Transcript_97683/g.281873  ORF Transcript_97683/g.281873 Transcript_97683/m.281873 type:complete len:201 (+) Transcript_97683:440-1042(+)
MDSSRRVQPYIVALGCLGRQQGLCEGRHRQGHPRQRHSQQPPDTADVGCDSWASLHGARVVACQGGRLSPRQPRRHAAHDRRPAPDAPVRAAHHEPRWPTSAEGCRQERLHRRTLGRLQGGHLVLVLAGVLRRGPPGDRQQRHAASAPRDLGSPGARCRVADIQEGGPYDAQQGRPKLLGHRGVAKGYVHAGAPQEVDAA